MLIVAILGLICILLVIVLIYNNYYTVEEFSIYDSACSELTSKREFLQNYINNLKSNVHEINRSLDGTYNIKKENMNYQTFFKNFCLFTRPMSAACKKLASTDKYPLEQLPNMDVMYVTLLNNEYPIDNLYQKLNYYSDLIGCSSNTVDASGYIFTVSDNLEEIDTATAFYELEKLSPYYLSPDTIKFILRFLISREKLNELNFTSKDYVNQFIPLVDIVKEQYN
jgi:hypothetical protein